MKKLRESKGAILSLGALTMCFIIAVAAVPTSTELNRAVEKDLNKIALQKDHVATHKAELKQSKKQRDCASAIEARRDLKKAKADLKKDKAYLKADKKALVQQHENEMKPTAGALKESKRDLCEAKKQLKKDMRNGNTSALVDDAQLVVSKQKAVNRYEAKLNKQDEALDNRLAFIDEQLEQNGKNEGGEAKQVNQEKFAWNATASTDKTYIGVEEIETTSTSNRSSAVLDRDSQQLEK